MAENMSRLATALAGRYTIERELGRGGMATVYLAEDVKLHRQVAIKVLRPELAASMGTDRFLHEIQLTAKLQHPQILPLHEAGEADGFLYYVMPYVEGESLRDRMEREGKLPISDAIRITDDIGAALNYADGRGVVHRDIKPENVMLTGGRAVVADFGIARAVTVAGGERLTATGLAVGTPAYMSPEQALGQEEVDGRSDVYALGCVVYEMIGGRAPFEGATPQALVSKHAVETVPGLRASDPAIPVFVERAVEKALAKTPADRFQSAGAFAEALTSGTVVARVGPRRWRLRTVGATVVVLGAALLGVLSIISDGPGIERLAVLPFTNLINDPEQEYFVQGMHEGVMRELRMAGVAVIARTSVMQYQNTEIPIRDIARELNVHAVIEASVSRTGDSVLLDARLVDPGTQEYLWFQSYQRDVRNVVELPREVTQAIVDEIQLALTPQAEARLASARPVNPDAYEAYLRGRFHLFQFTPADQDMALQFFETALQIDPDYALPHIGVSGVWGNRLVMGVVPPSEAGLRQKEAVSRALELDSTLGAAHGALAIARTWVDWDWDGAETEFQRALQLNPNDSDTRIFYGHFLAIVRNRMDEAGAQIERALELDPHNSFYHNLYGHYLTWINQYDDAIVQYRTALATSPNQLLSRQGLWGALEKKGMYDEALAEARAWFAARGDGEAQEALERGYAEAGYPGALNVLAQMLAARSRTTYVRPFLIADLYVRAGEIDQAFEWWDKAYEARDHDMVYTRVWALPDSVRNDPRFQDLLRRMNLPR